MSKRKNEKGQDIHPTENTNNSATNKLEYSNIFDAILSSKAKAKQCQ
jgi:hypothetical protein